MKPTPNTLEQLMRRGDVWRGHSQRFVAASVVDTGHSDLNRVLVNNGWPTGSLIEVCQPTQCGYSEWLLFTPALQKIQAEQAGYIVLLNPPALPFCQGLIQAGIDLDSLLVLRIRSKQDFIASYVELAHANTCSMLLAWQPKPFLNYTELRKCLLASHEGGGLYVLFSQNRARQQSSPATLRLSSTLTAENLNVLVFKQKGQSHTSEQKPIQIALPHSWQMPATGATLTAYTITPRSSKKP